MTQKDMFQVQRSDGSVEIRETVKKIEITTDKDPFYMTFLNFVSWMWDLRGNVSLQVMSRLMQIAEYNSGLVKLTAGEREDMLEEMHISSPAFSRAIAELISKGALAKVTKTNTSTGEIRVLKGQYMINPRMFWKGDLSKRQTLMITFETKYNDMIETRYDENDIPKE